MAKAVSRNGDTRANGSAAVTGVAKKRSTTRKTKLKQQKLKMGPQAAAKQANKKTSPRPTVIKQEKQQTSKQPDAVAEMSASLCVSDSLHVACTESLKQRIHTQCDEMVKQLEVSDHMFADAVSGAPDDHRFLSVESFFNRMVRSSPDFEASTALAFETQHATGQIEGIRRAWEESFMTEASGTERACAYAKGEHCLANQMFRDEHGADFVLKEFLTPRDLERRNRASPGHIPPTNPCIMCLRGDVLSAILEARAGGTAVSCATQCTRIHNFVGIPGEYCMEQCICSLPGRFEGLVDPVVMPVRWYFEPTRTSGLRALRQTIPYPELASPPHFYKGLRQYR